MPELQAPVLLHPLLRPTILRSSQVRPSLLRRLISRRRVLCLTINFSRYKLPSTSHRTQRSHAGSHNEGSTVAPAQVCSLFVQHLRRACCNFTAQPRQPTMAATTLTVFSGRLVQAVTHTSCCLISSLNSLQVVQQPCIPLASGLATLTTRSASCLR